jgi:hypothetical protein
MPRSRLRTVGTWTTVPTRAEWEALDARLFSSLDGGQGGTYQTNTRILGTGMSCLGPVEALKGGSINSAVNVAFSAGDGIRYATEHPGRTRQLLVHAGIAAGANSLWIGSLAGARSLASVVRDTYAGTGPSTGRLPTARPRLTVPLRVHDGGTIRSVSVRYRLPTLRGSLPTMPLRMRVVRQDLSGTVQSLRSPATISGQSADAEGWASPTLPGSAAAWWGSGAAKTLTIACDQNNVVDVSAYTYFLEVDEEVFPGDAVADGTALADRIAGTVRLVATAPLTLTGAATIDGAAVATGDIVLATGQQTSAALAGASANGLYVANTAGAWSRYALANAADAFTPGLLVRIAEGKQWINSWWRLSGPPPRALDTGATASPLAFSLADGAGMLVHSALVTLDLPELQTFQ